MNTEFNEKMFGYHMSAGADPDLLIVCKYENCPFRMTFSFDRDRSGKPFAISLKNTKALNHSFSAHLTKKLKNSAKKTFGESFGKPQESRELQSLVGISFQYL